jgi:DNA-3-methyladenine glycosylase I
MSSATAPASARTRIRCAWTSSPISIAYHDREWGVPLKDDRKLFEFLVLDAAQAGLSWEIILRKREGFRAAFDHFNAEKIARYDDKKIKTLLADPGIIRNRLKIESRDHSQSFENRIRHQQRPCLFGRAEGIRQLRPLYLAIC